MPSHNEYKLSAEIIALSDAKDWALARAEWDLSAIYFAEEPETCLCSHFPIIEVCVLHNRLNGNSAEVGNVCVNKFLGIPSKIIFDGIKRVAKDKDKALNASATHYAFRKGWVNDWEHKFLVSTARERILSLKQIATRAEINEKVLRNMRKSAG